MKIQANKDKECAWCQVVFQPNLPRQVYCSNKCRVASNRALKMQQGQQQQQTVERQAEELATIKARPTQHRKIHREVNPTWQLLKQQIGGLRLLEQDLIDKLEVTHEQIRKLTGHRKGAVVGALLGIMLILLLMAVRYDNRKKQPLGVTFVFGSVVCLCLAGLLGYYLGGEVHQQVITTKEDLNDQLIVLEQEAEDQHEQLEETRDQLNTLEEQLAQVPEYIRETVVTTDQVSHNVAQ